ncbi:hypothetical protein BJX76DRAFT_320100 [Aspergillus varians]
MSLRDVITSGKFFTCSAEKLLTCIYEEAPRELDRLKTAYSIPAREHASSSQPSPSCILFGKDYDEVNRTLVSIEALRKIHNDDYTGFADSQDPSLKLSHESFSWIRAVYQRVVVSHDDLYTLIISLIINDLGKSPTLAADYQKAMGHVNLTRVNHDAILHRVVTQAPDLIPCLAQLAPDHRATLDLGIEVGASFNFGQLAQAENVPASLVGLDCVKGNPFAFEMHFLEQIFDVAGAAGHEDHEHAKKLTEPIFQSYKIVYEVAIEYINGQLDRRGAYDANLTRRMARMCRQQGWEKGEELDVSNAEHRALMRLLCICNANTVGRAQLVWDAFYTHISESTRCQLVQGLNVDGSIESPAAQVTYIPAVCDAALSAGHRCDSERKPVLGAVFGCLARMLTVTKADRASLPKNTAVIERDIKNLVTVRDCAKPKVLDYERPPPCQVAIVFPEPAPLRD